MPLLSCERSLGVAERDVEQVEIAGRTCEG